MERALLGGISLVPRTLSSGHTVPEASFPPAARSRALLGGGGELGGHLWVRSHAVNLAGWAERECLSSTAADRRILCCNRSPDAEKEKPKNPGNVARPSEGLPGL